MAAHEAPKPQGSGASSRLSRLRRDPTLFGVYWMLGFGIVGLLFAGPLGVALGAIAFFVPRLPGIRLPR